MTPSIRTYLLIHLLLSVTLITSLAIIANLFLAHKDIQIQLDTQLIRNTLQMQTLFSDGIGSRNLTKIQEILKKTLQPSIDLKNSNKKLYKALQRYHQETSFQIWDRLGRLILHSKGSPITPLSSGKTGLSNLWSKNQSWRVYTDYDKTNQLTYMLGERSDFRQKLENELTQDSIFIMLITYPFLGVLIWIIVGRGLATLKKVTSEVSHRDPSFLEAVDIEAAPVEIKPLVAELNYLFERLRDAFEREKRFAGDAAHELKTPLAALKTQAQVALKTDQADERRAALRKMTQGVNRATHVVQQLLTLSRMLPQETINEPQQLDLNQVAGTVAADLAPHAIEKDIELELNATEQPAKIRGNATSLAILMRNLIDNAIRYTPEEGMVSINITDQDDQVLLDVIDNGPGIPDDLKERVFERFYRVIGNKAPGSGLGLGIVQQIAKLHNAKITLLDRDDKQSGLVFRVAFPKA